MKKLKEFKNEDDLQKAIIDYCNLFSKINPEFDCIFAIPNGGFRNIITATRLKRTGVKAGVPDLFLAIPKKGYHGLFIELKNGSKGKLSLNQKEWIKRLNKNGYKAVCCYSFDESIELINNYLI